MQQNYVTLNRMQSIVQPTAMNTNENLLICGESYSSHSNLSSLMQSF